MTDLAGSLVTSSRPPGRLQKKSDDRTSNAGVAVGTADGSRRTADAANKQYVRCGCSSPSCTVVLVLQTSMDCCTQLVPQRSDDLRRQINLSTSGQQFSVDTFSRCNYNEQNDGEILN